VVDASGAVTSIVFTGGNGYTTAPLVAIADSGVVDATRATASTELNIKSIQLVSNDPNHPEFAGGAGYGDLGLVTVRITAPTIPDASFVPAVATVTGAVADITLTNSGRGYVAVPSVVIPAPLVGTQATAEASSGGGSILVKNKAIQELFDPTFGRMNATLGVEIPFTSALTQTTIPLGYVDPVTEVFADGETQIWKITHNGVDAHPVHFHLLNVQVVNRIGWDGTIKPPMDNEYGWKETVRMNPLEDIVVAVRAKKPVLNGFGLPNSKRLRDPSQPADVPMGFTQVDVVTGNPAVVVNQIDDFGWEYVWHCHILGHEENDFMRPIKFNANEAVPAAPTVTALGPLAAGGRVDLIWTDNSSTEYKYEVTRMATMATGVVPVVVPPVSLLANATGYSDTPPAIGGDVLTYTYQVAAIGANGVGATSVAVPVTVAAPTIGATAFANYFGATLNWTDNSVNETQFAIEQSTDSGASWTVVSTPISANTVTTGARSATVNNLVGGTDYQFRVTAQLVAGATTFSSLPSATVSYAAPVAPPPLAPSNVQFTIGANSNNLTATFRDRSTTESQFVLSAGGTLLKTIASTTTVPTGDTYNSGAIDLAALLAPGANYTIGVVAQSAAGLQSASANAPRMLDVTTVPTAVNPLTPLNPAVAGNNRTFTAANLAAGFTVPAQTATFTYMPVTSYDVTRCQVSAPNVAGAVLAACVAGTSVTTTITPATPTVTGVGAALTGNNYWKYVITAKNLAGVSATKVGASR
jgi:hypothetical protein